jgi:hypothetical protein
MKIVTGGAGELPKGIYRNRGAKGFYARVKVGSGETALKDQRGFPESATLEEMVGWQTRTRATLRAHRAAHPLPSRGTLAGAVIEYLDHPHASLSPANRTRRAQQLAWWCAQAAARKAPIVSVEMLRAETEALARGETVPIRRRTLGELALTALDPVRLKEILDHAFAPSDPEEDPTEFARTSNHYRLALFHLFTVRNRTYPGTLNPVACVETRTTQGPGLHGVDMRIVREILKHVPSRFGRESIKTVVRIAVLAWVHITPVQLRRFDPTRDFHDVPDATREDILAGAITITLRPRLKGRRKRLPPPEIIPLNPWGVEAMRAFAAEPSAWGPKMSEPPMNKVIKRACRRTEAAFAARGIVVDLSDFTLYHLKHSLASAAQIASGGVMNQQGLIPQAPGVQRVLGHAAARTTQFYTGAAVQPLLRHVNAVTTQYLDELFRLPFTTPGAALRAVNSQP